MLKKHKYFLFLDRCPAQATRPVPTVDVRVDRVVRVAQAVNPEDKAELGDRRQEIGDR